MPLRETQSVLADWIRAPEGVEKALADDPTPDAARARLAALIRSDETLAAPARLDVYANAYFYRVLGVLAEDYAALLGLLGDGLFRDLVTSYLLIEPSRHPSLRYAGERLPGFLRSHPAAEGLRQRADWAADLAAFEWARIEAFDAEDRATWTREALASLAPEAFAGIVLRRAPGVQLRTHAHPVDMLWKSGIEKSEPPVDDEFVDTAFLVWRRDERVRHRRVEPFEARALDALEASPSFAALCEWVALEVGDDSAPRQAAAWLEQWVADGILEVAPA